MPSRHSTVLRAAVALVVLAAPAILSAQSASSTTRTDVQVHGHWTIEVRNPNGSMAIRREFDNQLLNLGGSYLAGLLTNEMVAGLWSVFLLSTNTPGQGLTCAIDPCVLVPPNANNISNAVSPNLDVHPDQAGVTLTGTLTATGVNTIRSVATALGSCPPASDSCREWSTHLFTGHSLGAAAIPVQPGQIVSVVVRITFSS